MPEMTKTQITEIRTTRKISFDPLWKKLVDAKINKTELAERCGISRTTITKMAKNEYVSLEVIEKIAKALDCDVIDILSILPVEE